MKILKKIDRFFAKIAIVLIRWYQYTLSPDRGLPSLRLKWMVCSHEPHCSEYSIRVFRRYGFVKWLFRASDRVLHCTPKMQKQYDPDHYKVVFCSSAPIGVPFLRALFDDNRFDIVGVVTMPDAPSGRGMKMQENIIKAETNKILGSREAGRGTSDFVYTPIKLNPEKSEEGKQFAERLKSKNPDFLVVIAYGKIIPQAILDIPIIAPINVHGSLLPKYRGASPLQSIFLNNEEKTGITIMKMNAWLDTGDMIDKLIFRIPFDRTVKNLIEKLQTWGPEFLVDTLWKYGKKMLGEVKQNDIEATLCWKIEKESWLIDPRKDSIQSIYPKYRWFYLRPKIYFNLGEKRVIIEEMQLDEKEYFLGKDFSLINEDNSLHKAVEKLLVKPEGKKAMARDEFVHWYLK